mmetsp:Transcript_18950/g.28802  ORF Transcript_18950/g.28802 Transcript_18950/m.28802 type:complete len:213 (+) Transcript_18950:840-1478(+)
MRSSKDTLCLCCSLLHSKPRSSSALILSSVTKIVDLSGLFLEDLMFVQNDARLLSREAVTRRWPFLPLNSLSCSMRSSKEILGFFCSGDHSKSMLSRALILSSVTTMVDLPGLFLDDLMLVQKEARLLSRLAVTRRWPCSSLKSLSCRIRSSKDTLFLCFSTVHSKPISSKALILSSVTNKRTFPGLVRADLILVQNVARLLSRLAVTCRWP